MNKVTLTGRLGSDPDMSYTTSGTAVTKFRIAVNRYSKSANGERKEETDWYSIVAWNQLAETCNNYLKKGQKILVDGRIQQRKYTDKNGVERLAVEVILNDMEMLTPKDQQSGTAVGAGNILHDNDDLGDLDDHPF